ncbi:insulinase family protein [Lacticigenium naphthae]|uniref:insulinase family protein n=1 Tax=Lacticigenium naphthae TaxID=515351 RepID=UPI000424CA17|nr:insulinase family protein [Lacticigenium naphthae]
MVFKKIEQHDLTDIHSLGNLYEHEETGAQVLHFENDDNNTSFTIGFKTPPYNDNGIAHIIEHSVLNGSKKYPSKEPFVELIKGSLNTFVNAMTFSDKTIYPVASTNKKDFSHLMSVYLDAVFQPLFYENPRILAQEGWHYHLEAKEDDLIYKGVVYNEMKGASASPERQVYQHLANQLYPDSLYSYNSGGEPKAIPSLTQEEFIAFHKKYYHPSNSFTIVYGDLSIDTIFENLEEYFEGKGKLPEDVDLAITPQKPKEETFTDTYSLTEGDSPENKDYLALGWHVAEPTDTLDFYGLEVLEELLFGNNQSPLKKALLDAEIGGDIESDVSDIGYPTAFMILAKYSSAEKIHSFKQIVIDTLTALVEKGLDKSMIQAALNKITFHTRESVISEDNPRGVIYAIQSLNTWLYNETPFVHLEFNKYLEQLSDKVEEGYFEDLIQRKFLNNDYFTQIVLKAEPGKSDKLEAKTLEKLQEYKASLSEKEIQHIVDETISLIERQETPDSPENLAKIPMLKREDLTTDVQEYPIETTSFYEETAFYHADQFTSGIDYIDLYFDITDFKEEDYSLLGYLTDLIGKLATNKHDEASLQKEMDTHTGGIYGTIEIYESKNGKLKPYFKLSGKALASSLTELTELMKEILFETKFDNIAELQKITQRLLSIFENKINFSSHSIVANRSLSQVKSVAKLNERVSGIDYFDFLKEMREELKTDPSKLTGELTQLLNRLVNKNRLNVLFTGDSDRKTLVKDTLIKHFEDLADDELGEDIRYIPGKKQNEAYVTAQDVNYVGLGTNAADHLSFTGSSQVLSTALRFDYLWNNVRVKGGAYGALYQHSRNGSIVLASYRDPNIGKTLEVYKQLPDYVGAFIISESELLKYIIGTLSPLEQPKSAHSKGLTGFNRLQREIHREDIIQLKEEILATDSSKIAALSEQYAAALQEGSVVVIGNKAQIEKEKELFDVINELY